MNRHESIRVQLLNDAGHLADFQTRDHTVEDFPINAGLPTSAGINRDSASQRIRDPGSDFDASIRNNRHGMERIDTMNDKVESPCGSKIRQDRIECGLNPQYSQRSQKQNNVEYQNDVANLQDLTAFADDESGDFGAVQHRATSNGEADTCTNEKPSEDRGQQQVRRNVRVMEGRQRNREPSNCTRASNGEGSTKMFPCQRNERQIYQRQQNR